MVAVELDGPEVLPDNRLSQAREHRIKCWVGERIWGHRFRNDQTAWKLLCECLGICAYRHQDANASGIFLGTPGNDHESLEYRLARRAHLRHLLYEDRSLERVSQRFGEAPEMLWAEWLKAVRAQWPSEEKPKSDEPFGYLRDRFASLDDLANGVRLLRAAEVESHHGWRPTSRHLTPLGLDMLTADFGEKGRRGEMLPAINKDRRFFARGGELVYLMLSRSERSESLGEVLGRRLFESDNRWNQLARALQPEGITRHDKDHWPLFSIGYLPLRAHRRYDDLAQDWEAVLGLAHLPMDLLPEHLMRLTGLGVVLYLIERASEILGRSVPPMLLDMLSRETRRVRELSRQQLALHRHLTTGAVEASIDSVRQSDAWRAALASAHPGEAVAAILRREFAWTSGSATSSPERQIGELKEYAVTDHSNHVGVLTRTYARQVGLATRRHGMSDWYGISDSLLESLVLANVREPMEFEEFLECLHRRYHMVVGPRVARAEFGELPVPLEQLEANQRRLEDRLRVIELAHRLSDDCAFVRNPFWT